MAHPGILLRFLFVSQCSPLSFNVIGFRTNFTVVFRYYDVSSRLQTIIYSFNTTFCRSLTSNRIDGNTLGNHLGLLHRDLCVGAFYICSLRMHRLLESSTYATLMMDVCSNSTDWCITRCSHCHICLQITGFRSFFHSFSFSSVKVFAPLYCLFL